MGSQSDFVEALFTPDAAPSRLALPHRFRVYRNNVSVALADTLEEAFPAVARLVGAQFFTAMVREFIAQHPPDNPIMALYGAHFPGWLSRFPPVASLPYLPEVAAIEQARREATHAADAAPLTMAEIEALGPEGLAQSCLDPHPALRLIATRHPALSIWARNAGREDLTRAPQGEVLINRPHMSLIIRPAPAGTSALISALSQGLTLAEALPRGTDHAALAACLFSTGAVIRTGAFSHDQ